MSLPTKLLYQYHLRHPHCLGNNHVSVTPLPNQTCVKQEGPSPDSRETLVMLYSAEFSLSTLTRGRYLFREIPNVHSSCISSQSLPFSKDRVKLTYYTSTTIPLSKSAFISSKKLGRLKRIHVSSRKSC